MISTRIRRLGALAAAATWLVAASVPPAGEVRLLTDFTGKDEWKVSPWSKAKGRIAIRPESPPQPAGQKEGKALGVKISFPGGGGFHFFNLLPTRPSSPISHKVLSVSVHLKGSGAKHYVQATFADADGADRKVELGQLDGQTWQKRSFKVPSTWPQPLRLRSISFHDWGINEPAEITAYLTRMEVEVDPNAKVALARGEPVFVGDPGKAGSWEPFRWNKAKGTVAVADELPGGVKPAPGRSGRSLRLDIRFAAGETFEFFQLHPAEAMEMKDPNTIVAARCWMKGSGTPHGIEFYFRDADGKEQKAAARPGRLDFDGWKLVAARVPRKWPQPVSFRGLGFHNHGVKDAAAVTVHLAEVVVEVGQIERKSYVPLPRVKVPGSQRLYSDLNLPGEWTAYAWNKAAGTLKVVEDFPDEVKTTAGEMRRSLQLLLRFGGDFQFFSINPAAAEPIPYHVNGMQLWLKGSETPHSIELHFTDAQGKDVKVSPRPGGLDFYGWQQITALIPTAWPQPLTLKGITLHNYSFRERAEVCLRATRLEVIIDPKRKLGAGDDRHKTNDNW
jgi:hypothetical protein